MELSTYSDIVKFLEDSRDDIMQTNVAWETKHYMRENIERFVYDAYTPQDYDRTGNLLHEVTSSYHGDGYLTVYSNRNEITKSGHLRYISGVIESGKGYSWGQGQLDERIGPRRYNFHTEQDMASGGFKRAFIEGYNDRGYKAE